MSEKEKPRWHSEFRLRDAEEVKEILSAVGEFIDSLRKPLKEMLDMISSYLDGDSVGKDVALFYSRLKEAGLPEERIAEMTREYLSRRLEVVPSISKIIEAARRRAFYRGGREEE